MTSTDPAADTLCRRRFRYPSHEHAKCYTYRHMTNPSKFPLILFLGYAVLFIILAINPYSRDVWFAENLPIFIIALTLFIWHVKGFRFSNISYVLMFVLLYLHTIGGHFTFERVPFEWVSDFFGFEGEELPDSAAALRSRSTSVRPSPRSEAPSSRKFRRSII